MSPTRAVILRLLLAMLLSLLTSLRLPAGETEVPRLAIVSTKEARDLAALMTERISKDAHLVLLERDDLAKAGDERRLVEMALTDGPALGRILGANGLLFLDRENGHFRARLTAVHLGVAVFELVFHKDAALEDALLKLEGQIHRLSGKLNLTQEQAVPLSVLNLRVDSLITRGADIERSATILLESHLTEIPEIFLLERRHSGALAAEHALNGQASEFLRGAYLIDGSLSLSKGKNSILASIRIRSPRLEHPITFDILGDREALPQLTNAITEKIAASIKTSSPSSLPRWKEEAREYLMEGVWAHRCGLPGPTLAALDSAELLGETAPDLLALRIRALCMLVTGSTDLTNPKEPLPDNPEPEDDIALLKRALADAKRFDEEKGESRLEILDCNVLVHARREHLSHVAVVSSLRMLLMLDRTKHSAAGDLREAVRAFLGYAPTVGKLPKDWTNATSYTGLLSQSLEEEIAYYRTLSTTYPYATRDAWRLQLVLRPDTFCARFIPSVEARNIAYFDFVRELLQDPVAKPAALLYLAQWASPKERTAACRNFYQEIWNDREELLRTKRLSSLLRYAFNLEVINKVAVADAHLIDALCFLFQRADTSDSAITAIWLPELFPAEKAAQLWKDLHGFEERVLAKGARGGEFRRMKRLFTDRFEEFLKPPIAPLPPLKITSFWCPNDVTEMFHLGQNNFSVERDTVHIAGTAREKEGALLRVYTVKLPNLETEVVTRERDFSPMASMITRDSILLLHHQQDGVPKASVTKYDRKRKQWSTHEVPAGTSMMYQVYGKIYLAIGMLVKEDQGGVALFDEETGEVTLLASSRRKPGLNQFDDCAKYRVSGIFGGPNGTVGALIDGRAYEVKKEPGEWPLIAGVGVMWNCEWKEGKALLYGNANYYRSFDAVIMIDSAHHEPEVWLGPVSSLKIVKKGSPRELILPVSPAWSKNHLWTATKNDYEEDRTYCFRGNDLLCFVKSQPGGKVAKLIYYRRGEKEPIHIPITFEIQPEAFATFRAVLLERAHSFGEITRPHETPHFLIMKASSEGLCFQTVSHGFWFLPYNELDAYLASVPKPPAQESDSTNVRIP